MRMISLVLTAIIGFGLVAIADTKPKAKATVTSITAKRDRLLTVRDKLRALAAEKEPEKLPADHKKAYDKWVAALKDTANQADALATKLTNGLKDKKTDLDSMSEMGETESLRLQVAMDRESKMMSTLSNILKKISDTASSITQNLK